MKRVVPSYILLIGSILLVIICCSKYPNLEDYLHEEDVVVNGFNVHWRACMTKEQREIVCEILNDMVLVEGGIFSMGSNQIYDPDARPNESPVHLVKLTDFFICAHELTFEQMSVLFPDFSAGYQNIRKVNNKKFLNYSWEDWNNILSQLFLLTNIEFSFPTEAQWEYAARGGKYSKCFLYPGSNDRDEVFADDVNGIDITLPNELGIFNMANCRSEWCADAYSDYSDGPMAINPYITDGDSHVVRGGCHVSVNITDKWSLSSVYYSNVYEDYRFCRSTSRAKGYSSKSWYIGCRPVINIKNKNE